MDTRRSNHASVSYVCVGVADVLFPRSHAITPAVSGLDYTANLVIVLRALPVFSRVK